jgi:hypothetical protein
MAVHLCDDDCTKISALFEGPTLCFRRLTDAGIQDKNRHVGFDSRLNLLHFFEELRLLPMPTTGINDNNIEPLLLKLCNTCCCNGHRVGLSIRSIEVHFCFGRGLTRLIKCTSTKCICTDDAALKASLLIVDRELGTRGRFAISLCAR